MSNEKRMKAEGNFLYSLIPLEDFKGLLSVDDRDDKMARFCLVTATHTIEQYCKRRLLKKKHFERIEFYGDLVLPLREYPVQKVLAVYVMPAYGDGVVLEPEFYSVPPERSPADLYLSPAVRSLPYIKAIKVIYWAGYALGNIPPDLASACLELATWNFNRYKGRRIGMTGNVRGSGKEGEHFEMSMPENVKQLLEPYRRRTI